MSIPTPGQVHKTCPARDWECRWKDGIFPMNRSIVIALAQPRTRPSCPDSRRGRSQPRLLRGVRSERQFGRPSVSFAHVILQHPLHEGPVAPRRRERPAVFSDRDHPVRINRLDPDRHLPGRGLGHSGNEERGIPRSVAVSMARHGVRPSSSTARSLRMDERATRSAGECGRQASQKQEAGVTESRRLVRYPSDGAVTETLSKVAVAAVDVVWLDTPRPT